MGIAIPAVLCAAAGAGAAGAGAATAAGAGSGAATTAWGGGGGAETLGAGVSTLGEQAAKNPAPTNGMISMKWRRVERLFDMAFSFQCLIA
jgi:hypothetical protein